MLHRQLEDEPAEIGRGHLALLLGSSFVSDLGDWLSLVALMVLEYGRSGTAFGVSTILFVRSLPVLLCGGFAGRVADRHDRQWTMVVANGMRSLGVGVLYFTQAVPVVYVMAGLVAAAGAFFRPALDAAVPGCVRPERLLRVNAWLGTGRMLAMVIGPALASLCIATFGVGTTFLLDGISFAGFGLAIVLIRFPRCAVAGSVAASAGTPSSRAAWSALRGNRVVMDILFTSACADVAMGVLGTLELVFCVQVLHAASHIYGWLVAVAGIGAVTATLLLRTVRPHRATFWYTLGVIAFGTGIFGFSRQTALAMTLPFLLLEGIGEALWSVTGRTLIQLRADASCRGWVMSVCNMTERGGVLVGMLLAGILAQWVAVQTLLMWAGGGLLVVAAGRWWMHMRKGAC